MKRTTLLVLLASMAVTAAQAGSLVTVYSNLGSPPQFDQLFSWQLDGGVVAGQEAAVAFTPLQTVYFANAQLAVGSIFSNLTSLPLDVSLAADSSGAPGLQLDDLTPGAGQSVDSWPVTTAVTYLCSTCPILSAGSQYWLVAQIPDLGNDYFESQAGWSWNTVLDYSTGANFAFNDTQFGGGWQFGDNTELRPAFQIDGAAVPEPAPALTIATTLLALALRVSRRTASRKLPS